MDGAVKRLRPWVVKNHPSCECPVANGRLVGMERLGLPGRCAICESGHHPSKAIVSIGQ
jgi:hypothetical protein